MWAHSVLKVSAEWQDGRSIGFTTISYTTTIQQQRDKPIVKLLRKRTKFLLNIYLLLFFYKKRQAKNKQHKFELERGKIVHTKY